MAVMTNAQAKALFDQGKINQQTYDSLVGSQLADEPVQVIGDAGMPSVVPNDAFAASQMAPDYSAVPTSPMIPLTNPTFEMGQESIAPVQSLAPVLEPSPINLAPLTTTGQTPPPVMPMSEAVPSVVTPQAPIAPIQPSVPMTESTTTSTSRKVATPGMYAAQGAIEAGIQAQKTGLGLEADVISKKADEATKLNQELQKRELESAEAEKKLRDDANNEVQQKLTALDSQVSELSNKKYDGFWQSKSTGEKILGALSIALGAYAQGMGAGPNTALAIINKAADDDFKSFQENVANKIKAIDQSRLSVEAKRKMVGDQILGLQAYKESQNKVIANKIEDLSNKFGGEAARAKLSQLSAQLDTQAAQNRAQFENSLAGTVTTQVQRKALDTSKTAKENAERYVPGVGIALTADDAKKVKDIAITKSSLDNKLAELIKLRQEQGGEVFNREAVGRGKQLSKQLLLEYKNLAKLGVLSESDMAIVEAIIPADPLQFEFVPGQDPTMEKLVNLQTDVNKMYNAELKTRMRSFESGANPQEAPAAPVTKVVNGKTYVKVPGGWQEQ